jgi:hypothetical protein
VAKKHVANAEGAWKAVSVVPDWCRVGLTVVPFDSYRDLSTALVASPNVNARGTPVYRVTDWIAGTSANAGSGLISQTSQASGHVQIFGDDTSVRVNGLICARHESLVWMNYGAGPNTVGQVLTDVGPPLGVVDNGKLPCNDPPETSDRLEQILALKEQFKDSDPDRWDEYVRLGDLDTWLNDNIAKVDIDTEGGWWRTPVDRNLQQIRGLLGFGKDLGMGLLHLGYSQAKQSGAQGQFHHQLDMAMLAVSRVAEFSPIVVVQISPPR